MDLLVVPEGLVEAVGIVAVALILIGLVTWWRRRHGRSN
jgi:hypothetical protein